MNLPVLRETPAAAGQYLSFTLQGQTYGVELPDVREIIGYVTPTKVPMMPAFVSGVINVRGHALPVIDLARRFGQPDTQLHLRTCVLIVEIAGHALGLLVDAVNAVLDLDAADIQASPAFGTGLRPDFLLGMGRVGDAFVILLDLPRILAEEELAGLSQITDEQVDSLAA